MSRRARYGFQAPAKNSPKIFWEGICDVESCTITVREGEVGSDPEAVVTSFSSPEATADAYDELIYELWHSRDFLPAADVFMSLAPVVVNDDLVHRIERAFDGVPRGRIGIREAAAIDARLSEDDEERATAREEDRETDWREIKDEVLAYDPAVFPHFDDQGFTFVLPAVMRWTISIAFDRFVDRWSVSESLAYALLHWDDAETLAKRWTLSPPQLAVVVEWLDEYIRAHPPRTADEALSLERWRTLASRA